MMLHFEGCPTVRAWYENPPRGRDVSRTGVALVKAARPDLSNRTISVEYPAEERLRMLAPLIAAQLEKWRGQCHAAQDEPMHQQEAELKRLAAEELEEGGFLLWD